MPVKLKAQLNETDYHISLSLTSDRAVVELDGRNYRVEVRQLGGGEYLLISGSSVFKCRVERKRDPSHQGETFEVMLRGHTHDVTIADPKRLRTAQSAGIHHPGAVEIISPMPGKIVCVLVEAGAKVEAGAGVIVVEAMKMQNEMKAPKAGIVVSVRTEESATVNAGDVLAVIE